GMPMHSAVQWSTATQTHLALVGGHGRRHIRAPHLVGALSENRAVVGLGPVAMANPLGGLKAVLPHQPPNPLLGSPDALVAEPGPDLAVTLAMERRLRQDAPDMADKLLIRAKTERAAPFGLRPLLGEDGPLMALEVDGGAG